MSEPTKHVADYLKERLGQAEGHIDAFIDRFREGPGRALDGCGGVFEDAANLDVFRYALECIEDGTSLDELKHEALQNTVVKARHPSMSTSPTSNLFRQFKFRAWAELHHVIDTRGRAP